MAKIIDLGQMDIYTDLIINDPLNYKNNKDFNPNNIFLNLNNVLTGKWLVKLFISDRNQIEILHENCDKKINWKYLDDVYIDSKIIGIFSSNYYLDETSNKNLWFEMILKQKKLACKFSVGIVLKLDTFGNNKIFVKKKNDIIMAIKIMLT